MQYEFLFQNGYKERFYLSDKLIGLQTKNVYK